MELLLALFAGMASGFLNVVAGGGTLIVFPTLVALGLSPLVANVTAAVGVFPGSLAGSWTYRKLLLENKKLALLSIIFMPLFSFFGVRNNRKRKACRERSLLRSNSDAQGGKKNRIEREGLKFE